MLKKGSFWVPEWGYLFWIHHIIAKSEGLFALMLYRMHLNKFMEKEQGQHLNVSHSGQTDTATATVALLFCYKTQREGELPRPPFLHHPSPVNVIDYQITKLSLNNLTSQT